MPLRKLAIVATVLCVAAAPLAATHHSGSHPHHQSRADTLHRFAHALEDGGLTYRPDVVVQVSGQPAAWGFSVPGCKGLLLLTVLPRTAQSWAHILPAVQQRGYVETYIYRGEVAAQAPHLRRLGDLMVKDLGSPGHDPMQLALIGLAEQGDCGLTARATALLQAYLAQPTSIHHAHAS